MNLGDETDADTPTNRIDAVLAHAGWTTGPGTKVRCEVICPGRVLPGGTNWDHQFL